MIKSALFILLTSCSSFVYGKELQTEDCVSRHMKILSKQAISSEFYEKIVDSCQQIYGGRP